MRPELALCLHHFQRDRANVREIVEALATVSLVILVSLNSEHALRHAEDR